MRGLACQILLVCAVFFKNANSQLLTEYCPLCGEDPVLQDPPVPNTGEVEFEFGICCPFADTTGDTCTIDPSGEALRTSGLTEPITDDISDFNSLCLTLDQFVFERSDRTPCCESCSCFGDPNCISFDNTEETWVVCDAREIPEEPDKRSYCKITEDQCSMEVDSNGVACEWAPTRDGIPESSWSVKTMGSPCQPVGGTEIIMYTADTFGFSIIQEERGNIMSAELTLGSAVHTLSAEDCVNNGEDDSWQGDPIDEHFQRSVEMFAPGDNNDRIWDVIDPETGISVTIRCTSVLHEGMKKMPRLNIEQISEPNPNFATARNPVGGFCVSGDLGNPNPSANTESIAENGYCGRNAPDDNVVVARIVCQNPSITLNGVGQCYKSFCNQHYSPAFDSFDDCFEMISNETDPMHWESTFCMAFNFLPGDIDECMKLIEQDGWDVAVEKYYEEDAITVNCVNNFDELPDGLGECEQGVELQYLNEGTGDWITVKGIPENAPPCSGVEITLCYEDYPQLFDNKIRFVQERQMKNCLFDVCSRQNGFAARLVTELVTNSPTRAPSTSPTTSEPTMSPTTSDPTASPSTSPTTSEPTASPTTSPTTSDPTASPSASPITSEPTASPSTSPTTSDPTASPSTSPTTSDPTASPSTSPTTSDPTASPSTSPTTSDPTASPSTSPTTSDPTASPSTSPTTSDPTASPSSSPVTSEPTASPSTSPTTSDPTASPSTSPTTSDPTASPSSSPVTSEPTASPSTSPTTSDPTASPSTSPTTSDPTASPSTSPTTSEPTASPSTSPTTSDPTASPSASPTTAEPTASPSTSPTTLDPTAAPTTSPTPDPAGFNPPGLCPTEKLIPIDIENSNLRFNNLDGKGPETDDECPFMWYENALAIDGESVDLVVRVLEPGTYRPSNLDPNANDGVSNNGKFFELGLIQLACDSEVFVEFMFIKNDCDLADPCSVATDTSCDIVPEVEEGDVINWIIYDLDQFLDEANKEQAVICDAAEILEIDGSVVDVQEITVNPPGTCDNAVQFTSTVFGTDADNPQVQSIDDLTMNQVLKLASASTQDGLSRVKVRYGVMGPDNPNSNPRCGRRILFSGNYCDDPIVGVPTPSPVPTPPTPATESPTESPAVALTPTPSPVTTPTPEPTTLEPTSSPVTTPTPEPTTLEPTSSPVTTPTPEPTTLEPTTSPETTPTPEPTTLEPTSSPVTTPTPEPTTLEPTSSPVTTPTPEPTTLEPTTSPVTTPTDSGPSASPTPDPSGQNPPGLCPTERLIPIDIENANLRFNNLDGKGPDAGDECPFIWYENALTIDGQGVDLVVRALEPGTYRPSNLDPNANDGVSNNGKFFELGLIQLACDSSVFVEFMFIKNDCGLSDPCSVATDTSCDIVPEVEEGDVINWIIYDLDQFLDEANKERAVICDTADILEIDGSVVDVEEITVAPPGTCDNAVQFTSTVYGTDADNPKVQSIDDLTMDQVQRLASASTQDGLARVKVRYEVMGPDNPNSNPRCGRRILFSGNYCDDPLVGPPTPSPVPTPPTPPTVPTPAPSNVIVPTPAPNDGAPTPAPNDGAPTPAPNGGTPTTPTAPTTPTVPTPPTTPTAPTTPTVPTPPTPAPNDGSTPSPTIPPALNPPGPSFCPPEDLVPINIEDANIRYNNLGGKGPENSECPVIWYENVFAVDGQSADLVVRVVEPNTYRPSNLNPDASDGVSNNGKFYELGQIQLACDSEVFVEFAFVRHDCDLPDPCDVVSNTACDLEVDFDIGAFLWRIYDLDQHQGGNNVESATVCSVASVQEISGSKVDVFGSDLCDDAMTFVSTVFGTGADNPKYQSYDELTQDQIEKLGSVLLKTDGARLRVKYGVGGPDVTSFNPRCGRRILFSGDYCGATTSNITLEPTVPGNPPGTPTTSPTPQPSLPPFPDFCGFDDFRTFDWASSTLLVNNLGGQGPNIDKTLPTPRPTLPNNLDLIWYQRVVEYQGRDLDIVIRVLEDSSYRPSNTDITAADGVSNNGKYFELGQINLACNSEVTVEYMFIDTLCAIDQGPNFDPSNNDLCDSEGIPDLEWTVMDLDHHANEENIESVIICDVLFVVPIFGQQVTITDDEAFCSNAKKLVAGSEGYEADNPQTPNIDDLDLEQIRKLGRVVLLSDISRFKVRYSLGGPDRSQSNPRCGRRILFSGSLCDEPIPEVNTL